jgi:RNA polymerase sigma-70 factor (ECF subfamily)
VLENQANTVTDAELVRRIIAGEHDIYEVIIRRYNQRLYRVARSMIQNQQEAEDIVQDTYARAFEHLCQFEGRTLLSTWLTKIAVNQARSRMKERRRQQAINPMLSTKPDVSHELGTPEDERLAEETRIILENAIDQLPQVYRSVFVMRSLEEMSIAETAQSLDIGEEAVKIHMLRARRMLRRTLREKFHAASAQAFRFLGQRCDRLTANVLRRINLLAIIR